MPRFEGKVPKSRENADQKHSAQHKESQLSSGQLIIYEQEELPVDETTFQSPVNLHAALMSQTVSDIQRSKIGLQLQQTYGNRYVQRLLRSVSPNGNQVQKKSDTVQAAGAMVIQRENEEGSGFGQLLNFWKGQESKGSKKYKDARKVSGEYKGENIKSHLASDIMAAAVKHAQATGKDLIEIMSSKFNWSKEDVEKYIFTHEQPFVKYLTSESAREEYELVGGGSLKQGKPPQPFDTDGMFSKHSGQGFGIYVMAPDGRLYAGVHKVGLFHHSSFLAGMPTAGAGELKVDSGTLQVITNKSGHYKPGRAQMINVLKQLKERGVGLTGVRLDLVSEIDNYPGGAQKFLDNEDAKAAQARARLAAGSGQYSMVNFGNLKRPGVPASQGPGKPESKPPEGSGTYSEIRPGMFGRPGAKLPPGPEKPAESGTPEQRGGASGGSGEYYEPGKSEQGDGASGGSGGYYEPGKSEEDGDASGGSGGYCEPGKSEEEEETGNNSGAGTYSEIKFRGSGR